jgi:hypothetical protein
MDRSPMLETGFTLAFPGMDIRVPPILRQTPLQTPGAFRRTVLRHIASEYDHTIG